MKWITLWNYFPFAAAAASCWSWRSLKTSPDFEYLTFLSCGGSSVVVLSFLPCLFFYVARA